MIDPIWPGEDLISVTPSDVTSFPLEVRMLYVGTGGNVSVTTGKGTTVVFNNVPDGGTVGPFFIRRVNSTGTTASGIVGFY